MDKDNRRTDRPTISPQLTRPSPKILEAPNPKSKTPIDNHRDDRYNPTERMGFAISMAQLPIPKQPLPHVTHPRATKDDGLQPTSPAL